ncbi:uncharacterized protein LOC125944854 [Dermacentor silvarum]|uniref:uncharacterized protein LOC125944854 n=1 Tax=Dermacentor silvarum TaxID=543639 RepID=UPI0021006A5D|nr:uncharacterized protein LOC125944854 [Dermacentor silvarum]
MTSAPESKCLLKGFSDVLDGRPIQFVGQLPAGLLVCSLCSVVPLEHCTLSCKHVYCGPCFLQIVMKTSTAFWCPVDRKLLRPRKAVPMATTSSDVLRTLVACCCNRDYGCSYTGTLEDMQAHVRDCYEVTCGLCSRRLPRSLLVSHVEAAHPATAKTSSAKSKRRKETAKPSTDVPSGSLVEDGDGKVQPVSTVNIEEPVATQAAATVTQLSHEHIQELIEATASRAASEAVEKVNQLNGTVFRDILGAVNLIYERLTAVTASSSVEDATAAPAVIEHRPKEKHLEELTWTVCRYSKLRVGIHYVESPLFLIAPGHRVQFTVCIDGITVVELSVSVTVHRGDDDGQPSGQPFQRTCLFTLLDKSGNDAHLTSLFTPKDLFDNDVAVSPSTDDALLASGWLTISKVNRTIFERDYIEDDGFTILFSAKP